MGISRFWNARLLLLDREPYDLPVEDWVLGESKPLMIICGFGSRVSLLMLMVNTSSSFSLLVLSSNWPRGSEEKPLNEVRDWFNGVAVLELDSFKSLVNELMGNLEAPTVPEAPVLVVAAATVMPGPAGELLNDFSVGDVDMEAVWLLLLTTFSSPPSGF